MKIGITLDEVLRDFVGQLAYTYTKYIDQNFSIKENEITNGNFMEYFKFDNKEEFNKFLYNEAALEVFGHADQLHEHIFSLFNMFLVDIEDEEEHEIIIINREVSRAIPSTLFFLSKIGCTAKNIKFVSTYSEMWNNVDVLISATPEALNSRPSGKISVKVDATYNSDISADYSIPDLMTFMRDENLRNKILNTKITTYEETN